MALFKIFNNFDKTTIDQTAMQSLQEMSNAIPDSINLPDTYHEGYMYFDAKNGMFYIDIQGDGGTTGVRIPVNAWGAQRAERAKEDISGNLIKDTYLTKANGLTDVNWDNTNKKLTKTKNGSTTDVVTASALKTAMGLSTISKENVIKTVTLSEGSLPTLGTAISADDITSWDAGSTPTLGTAFKVPNVTGNTSVTASKVTKTDNTVVKSISQEASISSVLGTVSGGVLTIGQAITTVGTVSVSATATASAVTITDVTASKVTLGTAFSIPNITSVGSVPSLSYEAKSIPNVTGVGSLPSLTSTTQSVVASIS